MNGNYTIGLFWIFVAGLTQGAFLLPMKFVRRWKWEHLWLVYSVIAFFALPWLAAWETVPHLEVVYRMAPARSFWLTALFGMGWGVGSVFFGLGVDALGLALGFSLATGIYTALGALVPMVILTPSLIWTINGLLILAGNAITIAGVVLLAVAGDLRDKRVDKVETHSLSTKVSFSTGLTICILSGVLSGMLNFIYAFGNPIAEVAQHLGATKQNGLNVLWLIALPAGGVVNVGYCAYLIFKRKSWVLLYHGSASMDWFRALMMSILWTGSVIIYGWGADRLGRVGPSLGWSLWNALTIITTVVLGFLTHEWDGVGGRPLKLLLEGIALLILATAVLGLGGAGG